MSRSAASKRIGKATEDDSMFCIWGYVTPESLLPLASVFCAAVGGLLLL